MKVILVRHELAGDRKQFAQKYGKKDSLRSLTKNGIQRLENTVQVLVRLEPEVDVIYSSPLVRAKQTAEIIQTAYKTVDLKASKLLSPEVPPPRVIDFLHSISNENAILVGHEPQLGALLSWLTLKTTTHFLDFKKGAFCALEIETVQAGSAKVLWYLPPKKALALY